MLTGLRILAVVSRILQRAAFVIALAPPRSGSVSIAETIDAAPRSINSEAAARAGAFAVAAKARHGTMNEHSQTTKKDRAAVRALAVEEAVPPPHPSPMPTQVIEFWTPRLWLLALLHWLGRTVRRAVVSPADSP